MTVVTGVMAVTGPSQRVILPRTESCAGGIITLAITEDAVGVAPASTMAARMPRTESDPRRRIDDSRRRRHSRAACWHVRKARLGRPQLQEQTGEPGPELQTVKAASAQARPESHGLQARLGAGRQGVGT